MVNALQTGVERVLVSHRIGDDLDWVYELPSQVDGTLPVPLPIAPVVPPTTWVARPQEVEHESNQRKQATDRE